MVNDVSVSFTMSNDRTVVSLVLSNDTPINNAMLAEILTKHAEVLSKGDLQ